MGTSADFVALHSDGRWGVSYVNYDGYPDGVGMMLFDHYNTQEKVDALLALGHLSSLGRTLDPQDTQSYARDRNEEDVDTTYYDSFNLALAEASQGFGSYLYAWDGQIWHYKGKPVPQVIEEEDS